MGFGDGVLCDSGVDVLTALLLNLAVSQRIHALTVQSTHPLLLRLRFEAALWPRFVLVPLLSAAFLVLVI